MTRRPTSRAIRSAAIGCVAGLIAAACDTRSHGRPGEVGVFEPDAAMGEPSAPGAVCRNGRIADGTSGVCTTVFPHACGASGRVRLSWRLDDGEPRGLPFELVDRRSYCLLVSSRTSQSFAEIAVWAASAECETTEDLGTRGRRWDFRHPGSAMCLSPQDSYSQLTVEVIVPPPGETTDLRFSICDRCPAFE